jgi:hypothetical protein
MEKWGAKSPDQEKIIALEAKVKELKDLKLSAELIRKREEDDNEMREGENENNQDDNEWMKIPPKDNEAKHKRVGKKTWHWCIHHKRWTVHKPDNCRLGKQPDKQDNEEDKPQPIASQATYAGMLAKLAHLSMDE